MITQASTNIDPNKPMFPISIMAEHLQLHPKTLRTYEDSELLIPARTHKNRRIYSINDLAKGRLIKYLAKDLGINITGIKVILNLLFIVSPDLQIGQYDELLKRLEEYKEYPIK